MKVAKKKIGKTTVVILTPNKGKVITRKDAKEPMYLHGPIWLGCNDSPDNWEEIDEPSKTTNDSNK